jgi:hypothetical protein
MISPARFDGTGTPKSKWQRKKENKMESLNGVKPKNAYLEHEVYVRGHRGAVFQPRLGKLAHQLVDGCHDARHLVATYLTVAVQIVQRERPPELVVH